MYMPAEPSNVLLFFLATFLETKCFSRLTHNMLLCQGLKKKGTVKLKHTLLPDGCIASVWISSSM